MHLSDSEKAKVGLAKDLTSLRGHKNKKHTFPNRGTNPNGRLRIKGFNGPHADQGEHAPSDNNDRGDKAQLNKKTNYFASSDPHPEVR